MAKLNMNIKLKKHIQISTLLTVLLIYSSITFKFIDLRNHMILEETSIKPSNSEISINTPENKTYTEGMLGYFPATYGFENDQNGELPYGWLFSDYDGGSFIEVDGTKDGHNKVLEVRKNGGIIYCGARVMFSKNASVGSVEFWLYKDTAGGTDATKIDLLGEGGEIRFIIENQDLFYGDYGTRVLIVSNVFSANIWYHVRIDFDVSLGWQIQLDDILYGGGYALPFKNTPSEFYGFALASHWSGCNGNYAAWLDALGCSWDSNYWIGDNLNLGLLLSFDSSVSLDTIKYSLDGHNNQTILGNTTFALPDDGIHSIQVFGNDSSNTLYESNLRYFTTRCFLYHRGITIDPATPESDFQVKIQLNPSNFKYFKAKSDGSDLRFYDQSDTELNYWIENWDPSGTSNIWVKVPILNTSYIIMKYGNPFARPRSNGSRVFEFFDDFEDPIIDTTKWNTTGIIGYEIVDGKLVINSPTGNYLTTIDPLELNSFIIEYDLIESYDFRINLYCSQSPIHHASGGGNFYQILAPWEGDDSRIDWFLNGYIAGHVITGSPYYDAYRGSLRTEYITDNSQNLWLNSNLGPIFDNVTLNKFSVSNTFLSLSKAASAGVSASIDFIAIRKYADMDSNTIIGPERSTLPLRNYKMITDNDYNWIDASGGTELMLTDDGYTAITLPFNFQFYNDTFSTIYLSANGYLSFGYMYPYQYSNIPFPSADPTHYYMMAPFWDDLYRPGGGHIYVQSFESYWVAEWQDIVHYPGSPLVGSFEVVLHEGGEIIFNYDYIDYVDGGYTCGLNLGLDTEFYNSYQELNNTIEDFSLLFSYEPYDHDLEVSLEVPFNPDLFTSYSINATVTNVGKNLESNFEFFLYIDEIIVASILVPELLVSESEIISFTWSPTQYKMYNISAYAPSVVGEEYIVNNIVSQSIVVNPFISGPVAIFRNNLAWDANTTDMILDNYGIDYTVYNSSQMGTVVLNQYEKVIIESDQDQLFYDTLGYYIPWFESYAASGGILEIHACDDCWHYGIWDGLYLMPGGFGQNHGIVDIISINLTTHAIVNTPNLITEQELSGLAIGSFDIFPSSSKQIMIDSITSNPVFIELGYGQGTILITMQALEFAYAYTGSKLLENVVLYNTDVIKIITPDSSCQWETDRSEEITWISTDISSNVKIEVYKNGIFIMEIEASAPNDGSYTWTIPSGFVDGVDYQIKISDISNPSTYAFSEEFEIYNPSIFVISPDTSCSWEVYQSYIINWTSIGTIPYVGLELYDDDTFVMQIIANTSNDGEFNWIIPSGLADSDDYQIKIIDVAKVSTFAYSDEFEIYNPTIFVISPDNLCIWETFRSYNINWSSFGAISDVLIEIYDDDIFVMQIAASTPNDGEFYWTIPSGLSDSDDYQIKISDASHPSIFAFSQEFELFNPSITILFPSSTCSWECETSHFINWTSVGTISNTCLELYKDGEVILEIAENTPNDGEFYWTIPSDLDESEEYQIKISDVSNPSIYALSENFKIEEIASPPANFMLPLIIGLSIGGVVAAGIITFLMRRKRT